jgi:Tol biopolymer transport system component
MAKRLVLLALLAGVLAAVPGPHDSARAAVPGTNGRIAFVRSAGAGPLEDTAPSWSPDGTRIAFARGGDQADGLPLHIHTVALADGSTSQVTGGKVQDLMPSWQPL